LRFVLCVLLPVAAMADVQFFDSGLFLGNYTQSSVYADPNLTYGLQNCATCGSGGGAALQELVTTPANGPGAFYIGLINNEFIYDPETEGTIETIDASVDKNISFNRPPAGGFTPTFAPLLEQGGSYYMAILYGDSFNPGDTQSLQTIWQTGLMATDFGIINFSTGSYDTSVNPDFSSSGAPIQFGLAPIVSVNDQFRIEADYTNLSFNITSVAPVPEPPTWGAITLLLGCLALKILRRPDFGSKQ
jgi:hypothetical protein